MRKLIGVDLRPLLENFESGVSVYTKRMVSELLKSNDFDFDLFYQASRKSYKISKIFPAARHLKISNTVFHLRSFFYFPRLPKNYFPRKPNLIWIPDRRPFYESDIPLVLTIHDMVPEKFSASLSLKAKIWHKIFNLKRLLKLCAGVLTPSESIKNELAFKKSEVTYEGANLSAGIKKIELPKDFYLAISPADPRKRLNWIFKAAKEFPQENFVIAGFKSGDKRFKKIANKKLKNLILTGEITEEEKHWLLKNTKALIAVSEYEGFDLPVLEAVEAKCPVILSKIAVHTELYKDATFVKSYQDLILSLKTDVKVPQPKQNFSWESAAKRALLFFNRVIADENR